MNAGNSTKKAETPSKTREHVPDRQPVQATEVRIPLDDESEDEESAVEANDEDSASVQGEVEG